MLAESDRRHVVDTLTPSGFLAHSTTLVIAYTRPSWSAYQLHSIDKKPLLVARGECLMFSRLEARRIPSSEAPFFSISVAFFRRQPLPTGFLSKSLTCTFVDSCQTWGIAIALTVLSQLFGTRGEVWHIKYVASSMAGIVRKIHHVMMD